MPFARLARFFVLLVSLPAGQLLAQSQFKVLAETASLRLQLHSGNPGNGLVWQRSSPTLEKPDGPVLYQLLLNASGTPGTVAMFDTNPRHLIDSPITVDINNNVKIGGLSIDHTSGIITFAGGQLFPGTGTVTSIAAGTGLSGGTITGAGTISIANGGVGTTQIAGKAVTSALVGSGAAPSGQLLTADGAAGAAWQPLPSVATTATVWLPAGYCTQLAPVVPAWGGVTGTGVNFTCFQTGGVSSPGTAVAQLGPNFSGFLQTTLALPTDWDGGAINARVKMFMPTGTGTINLLMFSACSADGVAQPTTFPGTGCVQSVNFSDTSIHTASICVGTSGCHAGDLLYIAPTRGDNAGAPQINFLGAEIRYGRK